jgi:hypothetical protein
MILGQSICIYHNGNSRILEHYKQKFSHLHFAGNLSESLDYPAQGHLWEVCFADATRKNLAHAKKSGVYILRHISTQQDDQENLLPECELFGHAQWLNHAVCDNLSFSDEVVCDFVLDTIPDGSTVIVTTGRTANTYFQEILTQLEMKTFENSKSLTDDFLSSSLAVLLWRLDQWECLTSTWIANQTDYKYSHQIADSAPLKFDFTVPTISTDWIKKEWFDLCCSVLDHSILYKYVIQRPIYSATTERIIDLDTNTAQQKIVYDKSKIIPDYEQSRLRYEQSEIAEILNMLYNQTQHHIKEIDYEETLLHGIRAV